MKTIIHVDQHILKRNRTTGSRDAALTVKTGKMNVRAYQAIITGPSCVIYRPEKPLGCGATVWIETRAEVLTIRAPERRAIS
jgi:hypothetical protein